MPRSLLPAAMIVALAGACASGTSDDVPESGLDTLVEKFFAACKAHYERASEAGRMAVRGEDGFLFLSHELRHLSVGPFWGEHAEKTGRAEQPDQRDPLPAIVDYHEQLTERGIDMVFVPVPPKAVIYPDKLGSELAGAVADFTGDDGTLPRLDTHHQAFYDRLREAGVPVVDLTDAFLKARQEGGDDDRPLYCRQDSHWSGRGLEIAADAITDRIGRPDWLPEAQQEFTTDPRRVRIRGDLYRELEDEGLDLEREELELNAINDGEQPITDRESPIVLLGDSHLLVFHIGGDMHATGAGLGDHMAHRLGVPLDVVGVRGSGATASRMTLLRRRDDLEGKKMIIWCLSARELTEASAWAEMPAALPPR